MIESGAISYKFAQKVKEQLEKVDCRILGVILNKVNMSGKGILWRLLWEVLREILWKVLRK